MPAACALHPDRRAATLANLAAQRAAWGDRELPPAPGAGAADCRIDLKLLLWQALAAARRSPAARAHLEVLPAERYPHVWAGTVQDGVARGFMARLEEAVALAPPAPARPPLAADTRATVISGRDLRKKRDILIASAGPRVRFLRKTGLTFVDRERGLHSDNCLWFEARRDLGTLDGFAGAGDERPRLFSAQFLQPSHHASLGDDTELVLDGRLGRGVVGWPCRVTLRARGDDPGVALTIELRSAPAGWRLRTRLLGLPPNAIHHACTPVREVVANDRGGFVADTLVRACTVLQVEDLAIAVPAAACSGVIVHEFRLGGDGLDADPR